ncbi:hypothetical protein LCGC14_0317940 [marine sediment metagenome]|uniref:Uncharacterized protein n=1 Tax=marine sediment metagenome TaxID=412755 RepID=A0A0F9TJY0_9ZZZZ
MAADEETEALRERVKYLEAFVKALKWARGRGQPENELNNYIHDLVNGSIQDCVNQHGNQMILSAKASLLKRIQGQLCSPHVRRKLVEKILDCERETIKEADGLLSQGEEG